MPEFVMQAHAECIREESEFVAGFIEALFFTETSPAYDADEWFSDECREAQEEGTADGRLPGDVGYSDIHSESLAAIRQFCEAFQVANAAALSAAYEQPGYDETRAGRDLWFTSQGHGTGFWERKELEPEFSDTGKSIGDVLSNAAQYNEANVWFGNHVDYGDAPFVHFQICGAVKFGYN